MRLIGIVALVQTPLERAKICCVFRCTDPPEFITYALGFGNPTKVARSNQQKHAFTTASVGTFLLIAAYHLRQVSVAQGTYHYQI